MFFIILIQNHRMLFNSYLEALWWWSMQGWREQTILTVHLELLMLITVVSWQSVEPMVPLQCSSFWILTAAPLFTIFILKSSPWYPTHFAPRCKKICSTKHISTHFSLHVNNQMILLSRESNNSDQVAM